jgi:hypothetical protein
MMLFDSVQNKR